MFKVKAIYEYASPHDDDLQFPIGQIITVTDEEDDDWYSGEYTDDAGLLHEGIFPRNFVEKYEPVAPPRPTRTRHKHSEASVASLASPISPSAAVPEAPASPSPPSVSSIPPISPPSAAVEETPEPERIERVASPVYTAPAPAPVAPASPPKPAAPAAPLSPVVAPVKPADLPISTSPVHKPAPACPKQGGPPPPVSEKPSSFRDRIAAFNKAAAPPITPFKPSGLGGGGSSNFIKKPFVAPPPSRNAYVPQPREAPTAKIYRRDEDPEVREQEAENLESAEKAGLIPGASAAASGTSNNNNNEEEEEPKPMMSLKERLARLQREQQEQAQRHADAAAKKDKPKRPPKKRLDSHDATAAAAAAADEAAGSAPDTSDAGGRHSIDDSHPPRTTHAPRRRASKDPEAQDGNDADMSGAGDTTEGQDEDLTERDDSDEKSRRPARPIIPIVLPGAAPGATGHDDEAVEDEEEVAEKGEETAKGEDEGAEAQEPEEEEEEEDVDPEVRRREELRARMAKMSGGMGMMGMQGMQGMFGAPPPSIKKKKASTSTEKRPGETADDTPSVAHAPPIPTMMALPGLATRRSEDKPAAPSEPARPTSPIKAEEQEEEQTPRSPIAQPPPLPTARPAPPPPPAAPPAVKQTSEGSESDDELSEQTTKNAPETSHPEPPPPPPAAMPTSPTSPVQSTKRMSRIPPPIPGSAPALPPVQTRPPPPPPPGGGISRQSTMEMRTPISPSQSFQQNAEVPASSDGDNEEEVTEYEGDYDTDIANPVPHKNSLKSHARDSSLEDSVSLKSPVSEKPSTFPPPVPGTSRAPPPIPNQPPPPPSQSPHAPPSATADRRRSVDVPRGPPPPPPPPPPPVEETEEQPGYEDSDYDPYNYVAPPAPSAAAPTPGYAPPPPQPPPPPSQAQAQSFMGSETYTPPDLTLAFAPGSASPSTSTRSHPPGPPPPPPPPSAPGGQAVTGMHSSRATRQSMDMPRASGSGRRSVDVSRPSMESGFVANEIDLAPQSGWWLQPNSLPPQLQGRRDIFFESEESQTAKRGGKVAITRDIYVLYLDYSQTVITVRFDPTDASDVQLEQRHEGPPLRLRQDQLEQSYERFGRHIADSVVAKKDTVVGDGTPQGLVLELVRPFRDALLPVGTRAYGALVYSNLANASTTQNDEIRAGDIITLRNARFQGKHGPMHAKYSMEVGKPDHVGVVSEWDGTKKKVRAWEQGRESKKVKLESFKLDDLRSGEVKVWRVMPRSWVGWEGQN